MFHTLAWYKSATGGGSTDDLTPVSDLQVQISNGHFILPVDMTAKMFFGMGATMTRLQLTSPSIRQISAIDLTPLQNSAAGADSAKISPKFDDPITLKAQEEIVLNADDSGAGGTPLTAIAMISDKWTPAPSGSVYTTRATSTTAATANKWSEIDLTFDVQLPSGKYVVVGGKHASTNGQAFRLTFSNQFYRPGGLSVPDIYNKVDNRLEDRMLGLYGQFDTVTLPRCEVLCDGADASHTLLLDIIKVA